MKKHIRNYTLIDYVLKTVNTNFICESMSLDYIGVNVFSAEFGERLKLRKLDLSFNFIEKCHENQFIYLTELSYLNLYDNNIGSIGNALFRNNTKLK